MTRLAIGIALLAALALAAAVAVLARSDGAAAQAVEGAPVPPAPQFYVLRPGDTVQVEGAGVGCQVTQRDGRPGIECRTAGRLEGTYGTFITAKTVTVARFRSADTAKTLLTANHRGAWRTCSAAGRSGRAAASGAGGCR